MPRKRVAFIRQYDSYTGGHQKVRDYIDHFLHLGWEVSLTLRGTSPTHPHLFSHILGVNYTQKHDPAAADLVFLAGMDWEQHLNASPAITPVINLIQHTRHALPDDPRYSFLTLPATRLCVSRAVCEKVAPLANGTTHWIKMGHHFPLIDASQQQDLFILATKAPDLGERMASWARRQGWRVQLFTAPQEPLLVKTAMASSHVSLVLPHAKEGFYFPGIEAMYYSNWAVIPDCEANQEYCAPFSNGLSCDYTENAIKTTVVKVMSQRSSLISQWRKWRGRQIASSYSLRNERQALAKILATLAPT